MVKKKYYAVKKGKIKGVYLTWNDCQMMILGYKNAVYKSFEDPYDAMDFVIGKEKEKSAKYNEEYKSVGVEIEAYVDGSFDSITHQYGYGGVLIKDGKVIEKFSKKGANMENLSMRNVAGEIEAAMYAMDYCRINGYKSLKIYYDYNGIEKWCSGEWKANKEGTKSYKEFCDNIKKDVNICFEKVKAHTGVLYNDMADELAKASIFGN